MSQLALKHRLRNCVRRAPLVRSPMQFAAGELLGRRGVSSYVTRRGGQTVLVRHHNVEDAFVLEEIFGRINSYAVPTEVAAIPVERVVDVGGNIGLATLWFAQTFPAAHFDTVEADPVNAQVLRAAVALNGLGDRVTVHPWAAGVSDGTLSFVGGQGGRSHIADAGEAGVAVPMRDVLPLLQDADLLKIDIEGGEWPILSDPRLADTSLRAMCLEYHAYMCPGTDPTDEVKRLLAQAGFEIAVLREEPPGGVVWAVRR